MRKLLSLLVYAAVMGLQAQGAATYKGKYDASHLSAVPRAPDYA